MTAVPSHIADVNEVVTISSQTSEDEISDNDDVYGLTSEDEAFVPLIGENLRNFTFNTTFSPIVNLEVHDRDALSYFESNDDVEYNLSSEGNNTDEGEGLDGCHLKGPYDGVLLAAVSLDGNNGLFSIDVRVVES
ncbi:hypothetical protein F0562_025099 [Nyssa sinensis]|uniref:Uncharacterized protein n=1 Tax=Nyssa sinensis TaxID=561372 RepID=A0A5J5BD92_9ASTE|nr:hypothetical protein F0562_025099 [Nyssa sinensis]